MTSKENDWHDYPQEEPEKLEIFDRPYKPYLVELKNGKYDVAEYLINPYDNNNGYFCANSMDVEEMYNSKVIRWKEIE